MSETFVREQRKFRRFELKLPVEVIRATDFDGIGGASHRTPHPLQHIHKVRIALQRILR